MSRGELTREQFKILALANAEMLEKEICELEKLSKERKIDYGIFWFKSSKIHELFKKIDPLLHKDRKRLWKFFAKVREDVRKKQTKEKALLSELTKRLEDEIEYLLSEVESLISNEELPPHQFEELIFCVEQLRSVIKNDFELLPDTPEIGFILARLKGQRIALSEKCIDRIFKVLRSAEKYLNDAGKKKEEELRIKIEEIGISIDKWNLKDLKQKLKEINREILGPYLVRAQKVSLKDKLVKIIEDLEKEEKEKGVERVRKSKMGEIRLLLKEFQNGISKES